MIPRFDDLMRSAEAAFTHDDFEGSAALYAEAVEVARQFGDNDLRLLNMFAPQAAVAIENARLFTAAQHQRQYFEELVQNSPVAMVLAPSAFQSMVTR